MASAGPLFQGREANVSGGVVSPWDESSPLLERPHGEEDWSASSLGSGFIWIETGDVQLLQQLIQGADSDYI